MGWNYWFNWANTVAVDVSTSAIVLRYWFLIFLALGFQFDCISNFAINALSKIFGETEYWLALIKVITVIVFLIVGLLTIIKLLNKCNIFRKLHL